MVGTTRRDLLWNMWCDPETNKKISAATMWCTSLNSGTNQFSFIVFSFNGNQSIYEYWPRSGKNIPSSLNAKSTIFCAQKVEWLLIAINPAPMWCTSLNSGTNQFSFIVFSFNGNQSIYDYCPWSRKNIPSSLIAKSTIFCAQKVEWLLIAISPAPMWCTHSILVPTNLAL